MLRKKSCPLKTIAKSWACISFTQKNAKFFQKVFLRNLFQSNIEPFYDNIEKVKRINMLGQKQFHDIVV